MSDKKSLEEQIGGLTLAANAWVEPMRQWLKQAYDLNRIAKSAEPGAIKQAFAEIEGLNLFLENKEARLRPRPPSVLPLRTAGRRYAPPEKSPMRAKISQKILFWCAERESNPHVFWTRDFKSLASTNSAISHMEARTGVAPVYAVCRPARNCSANAPHLDYYSK